MKVILTHGYYITTDERERKIMKPYPPLGLLYISAYLNKHEISNSVFDSTFHTQEEQLDYIKKEAPTLVALYTNLMTKVAIIKLIKCLKSDPAYHFPTIVLGGPDVSYNLENYLRAGADFNVIGEGEETLTALCRALNEKKDPSTIDGIAFLRNNTLVKTLPRTKFKDLADLPLPNREGIAMERYLETWKTNHGYQSMTISTQRGCPYTCKWCSTAVYGQSYRRRPPNKVAEEMLYLKQRYQPDALWFVDDVFTISHKWLKEFHDEVLAQGALIPFECITRAERITDDVLVLLKKLGCFRVWIGAESGSQKIIDLMDRRVDIQHVKQMIQQTNAMGIQTGTFIMLGYPEETLEDIQQTVAYLKQANPTEYTITVAYPIKGTSLYTEIEPKITHQPDWETSTDREIEFERTYSRKFYDYAVRYVVNAVEYHKEVQKSNKAFKAIASRWAKKTLFFVAMHWEKRWAHSIIRGSTDSPQTTSSGSTNSPDA